MPAKVPKDYTLGRDEVHVWLTRAVWPSARIRALTEILAPEETQKAQQFYFQRDAERHIIGRALARVLLGQRPAAPSPKRPCLQMLDHLTISIIRHRRTYRNRHHQISGFTNAGDSQISINRAMCGLLGAYVYSHDIHFISGLMAKRVQFCRHRVGADVDPCICTPHWPRRNVG